MDFQTEYRAKLRTPEEAVQVIKSGDWVDYSCNVCFPVLLDAALHPLLADYAAARAHELRGNGVTASALYAAFERGLCEKQDTQGMGFAVWDEL